MALKFVTPPAAAEVRRIGDEQVGVIEVPVRRGLTVTESDFVADLMDEVEPVYVAKAKAADAIATSEKISRVEAMAVIDALLDGEQLEDDAKLISERHEELLLQVASQFRKYVRFYRRAVVSALIRYRLGDTEWEKTMTTLDPVLFDGLYQLATEEQVADQGDAEPPTEEELGKPPEANGNGSGRTGTRSSGRSPAPTPASSAETPLATSCAS